jgi:hypothetical protein
MAILAVRDDKKAALRDKRAQRIAAKGLVTRVGDRFHVETSAPHGRTSYFEVWRDAEGRIRCFCPEFEENGNSDATFRCEHILAVKHALVARNSEAVTKNIRKSEPVMNNKRVASSSANAVAPNNALHFTNSSRATSLQLEPAIDRTLSDVHDADDHGHMPDYIEWYVVADLLDRVAPTWSHSVRSIVPVGELAIVTVAITIGDVTREGISTARTLDDAGIERAEEEALKRATLKFSIGREFLRLKNSFSPSQHAEIGTSRFQGEPIATSMSDLVTPRQLGMIRSLAREAGVDADIESRSSLGCATDELSRLAASNLIAQLSLRGHESSAAAIRRAS